MEPTLKKRGSPLKQAWDEYNEVREKFKDPDLGHAEHFKLVTRANQLLRRIYALTPRGKFRTPYK